MKHPWLTNSVLRHLITVLEISSNTTQWKIKSLEVKSWSLVEISGRSYQSFQEYKRLDSECNKVAIAPAKNSSKAGLDLQKLDMGSRPPMLI